MYNTPETHSICVRIFLFRTSERKRFWQADALQRFQTRTNEEERAPSILQKILAKAEEWRKRKRFKLFFYVDSIYLEIVRVKRVFQLKTSHEISNPLHAQPPPSLYSLFPCVWWRNIESETFSPELLSGMWRNTIFREKTMQQHTSRARANERCYVWLHLWIS